MNECRFVLENLDAYVDGEAGGETRARIEAHLASCPRCREALEELNNLNGLLKRSAVGRTADRIDLDLVSAKVVNRIVFRRRAVRAAMAIAAVFLIGITLSILPPSGPGPAGRDVEARVAEILRSFGGGNGPADESLTREILSMGDRAIPVLVRALSTDDVRVQLAASRLLALCANEKTVELIARTAGEDPEILGPFGADPNDAAAIPALVRTLKAGTPREQIRASELLCRFEDASAIATVIETARDEGLCADDDEWTIGELGEDPEDARLLPLLLGMVDAPATREFALDAIRRTGVYHRQKVVNALLPLMVSEKADDQRRAQDVILHANVSFAPLDLVELLDHPDLGAPARRMLVEIAARLHRQSVDLGADKESWRKWLKNAGTF